MCSLPIFLLALFFSLAIGPQVMLLYAQETPKVSDFDATRTSDWMTNESRNESGITLPEISSLGSTADPTTVLHFTTKTNMASTQAIFITPLPEITETEVMSQDEPNTTEDHEATTTHKPVTPEYVTSGPAETEATTVHLDDSTVVTKEVSTTPEVPQTSSPAVPTSAPTTTAMTETIFTEIPITEQAVETPPNTMTTSFVFTKDISDIGSISDYVSLSDDFLFTATTTFPEDITPPVTDSTVDIKTNETSGQMSETGSGSRWMIIIIIAVAIICMLTAFCVIIVKRRKKRGKESFGHGYMNGRNSRSKKKKKEDDAWAGPVILEGGQKPEGEDPEEGKQGDVLKADGTDAVLSTFAAVGENGGVGRPGSMEAQKWEEKEPLLFIDEDMKGEGKEKQKESLEDTKGKGQKEGDACGEAEIKEVELNGEAFCLTTAV